MLKNKVVVYYHFWLLAVAAIFMITACGVDAQAIQSNIQTSINRGYLYDFTPFIGTAALDAIAAFFIIIALPLVYFWSAYWCDEELGITPSAIQPPAVKQQGGEQPAVLGQPQVQLQPVLGQPQSVVYGQGQTVNAQP